MNRFKLQIYINHLKEGVYYYLNCHDLINKWTEYGIIMVLMRCFS